MRQQTLQVRDQKFSKLVAHMPVFCEAALLLHCEHVTGTSPKADSGVKAPSRGKVNACMHAHIRWIGVSQA